MGDQRQVLPFVIVARRLGETITREATRMLRMKASRQKYLDHVTKPHLRAYYERLVTPDMYADDDFRWVFNRQADHLPDCFSGDVDAVVSYAVENNVGNPSAITHAATMVREFNESRSVSTIRFDAESVLTIAMESLVEIENHALRCQGVSDIATPDHLDETDLRILQAVRDVGAVPGSGKRTKYAEIAPMVKGYDLATKQDIDRRGSRLVKLGLLASKTGREGGIWITQKGMEIAK